MTGHPKYQRRLCSVRMHGGQGDVIMAIHGLQALRELGQKILANDAVVYTRSIAAPVARLLLPDVTVKSLEDSKHAPHPRYAVVPRTSWSTVLRNWFYSDWYVNFPERRLLASYGYPRPSALRRAQLWLTDLKLGPGTRWRRETPSYYGLKIWAPLAERFGLTDTDLMRGLYLAHRTLSARLRAGAMARADVPAVAFFPSGKAFQYLPAAFIKDLLLRAGVGPGDYACWFAPGDRWQPDYERAGLHCRTSTTDDELLAVLVSSKATLTCDSYVSHLAQLTARRHIALMSHDLPQHTVHPAAASVVVYEPQDCCPCWYALRETHKTCLAGHAACGVFAMPRYGEAAAAALRAALAAGSRGEALSETAALRPK